MRNECWSVIVRDGSKVDRHEGLIYVKALELAIEHNDRACDIASAPGWDCRLSNLPYAEIIPPADKPKEREGECAWAVHRVDGKIARANLLVFHEGDWVSLRSGRAYAPGRFELLTTAGLRAELGKEST